MSTNKSTQDQPKAPALIAYHVEPGSGKGKAFWRKIGAAWPNRAGGFQLRVSAIPMTGDLVLLPPRESDTSSATKGAA